MGEREVELAGRAVSAFNAHDVEGLKAIVHPDCEIFGLRSAVEGTSYRGREGIERFVADALETWEDMRLDDVDAARREFEHGP